MSVPVVSGPATSAGSHAISWSGGGIANLSETQTAPLGETGVTAQVTLQTVTAATSGSVAVAGRAIGIYYYRAVYATGQTTPTYVPGLGTINVPVMAYTNAVTVVVPPQAPASLSAPSSAATANFAVTWAASAGATSYQLDQSSNGGASWTTVLTANATSYTASVSASGTYSYRVRACLSGYCSANSVVDSTVVSLIPAAPTLSNSTANSINGNFSLSWNAAANATSYQLDQSNNGGASWTTVQNAAASSFTASGFGNGTYSYRVRACNSFGCSANSNIGTTTVLLPPTVPALTVPATNTTGAVSVSWSAVATATSYELRQSLNYGAWTSVFNGNATGACL